MQISHRQRTLVHSALRAVMPKPELMKNSFVLLQTKLEQWKVFFWSFKIPLLALFKQINRSYPIITVLVPALGL